MGKISDLEKSFILVLIDKEIETNKIMGLLGTVTFYEQIKEKVIQW